MSAGTESTTERWLTPRAVRQRLGISHATLFRWCRDGRFPPPCRLSPGRVAFRETDIVAWEANLEVVKYAAAREKQR